MTPRTGDADRLELFGQQVDPRPERGADDIDQAPLAPDRIDGGAGDDATGGAIRSHHDLAPHVDEAPQHAGARARAARALVRDHAFRWGIDGLAYTNDDIAQAARWALTRA